MHIHLLRGSIDLFPQCMPPSLFVRQAVVRAESARAVLTPEDAQPPLMSERNSD